jgi:hypothetical protein
MGQLNKHLRRPGKGTTGRPILSRFVSERSRADTLDVPMGQGLQVFVDSSIVGYLPGLLYNCV